MALQRPEWRKLVQGMEGEAVMCLSADESSDDKAMALGWLAS
jgi:hypothetical protein